MKKDAEQLQLSLQRAADGEKIEGKLASLVQTAQLASSLAELPPPPPNQLAAGRRRFLTEAARLRAGKRAAHRGIAWQPATLRLVGALVAAVLVFGLVFGAGQAAADSLPGDTLYALKLTIEASRMQWTTDLEARADLAMVLVEERLDEITRMMGQGQSVDEPITNRASEQLALALQAIHQLDGQAALGAVQRLENTLQVQEQAMMHAASTVPEAEQGPVQALLREINRVRQELHTGQGEPEGEQHRLGTDTPPALPGEPKLSGQPGARPRPEDKAGGPEPEEGPGPGSGSPPEDKPVGPEPEPDARSGPGPWPDERPARPQQPAGPKPDEDSGSGPGGQPDGSQPDEDPGSGSGPGGQPDGSQPEADPGSGSGPGGQPDGSQPGADPGSGSGPGGQPDGSQPEADPGSGPGPGGQPDGSQPGKNPGSGSGSQPAAEPQPPDPAGTTGSQPPTGTGTDPGSGNP